MSLATSNRDGGRTNEAGHLRGVTKGFIGQVLNGLVVSQRAAGANMSVDVAIGDSIIKRSDGTYGHPAWNDAVYNQAISTADPSNPRRDIIVKYIDYGQTPSTGVANNTNGVVKIKSVSGTAAGSPVDPTDAAIQTSVGAGNPFVKLARVRVAAGATSISNSVIDDLRILATGISRNGWVYDDTYTWVYASASSFTIAGVDATSQFPVGARIMIRQSGSVKYFTVVSSTFSTNTTVNLDGGGTYTLTNVPIDIPAFSYSFTPTGFPRTTIQTPNDGFVEIGRAILTVAGDLLTVSSMPAKKYLRIYLTASVTGGTGTFLLRFNNDSAANYNRKYATDWAGVVSEASITAFSSGPTTSTQYLAVFDVINVSSREKLIIAQGTDQGAAGAANVVVVRQTSGKWSNTSAQITRVDLANGGTGDFAIGSEIVIYGRD